MKSNKQRRKEIKNKRRERAIKLRRTRAEDCVGVGFDVYTMPDGTLPPFAVYANHAELDHNESTYSGLPYCYVDKSFLCRDCGSHEVWKAKQQKWWYEIIKADINSQAVRCRMCRKVEQARIEDQQRHMEMMANKEIHPNELFFKRK